jgi:hypothetical protein
MWKAVGSQGLEERVDRAFAHTRYKHKHQLAHLVPWKLWERIFLLSHWFWEQSYMFPDWEKVTFLNVLRKEVKMPSVLVM